MDKVYIVGIGDNGKDGCSSQTISLIERADILFGGERHLDFFPKAVCEKVVVKSNLKEVAARIQSDLGKKRMVVLASGDPLFYGIGKYLLSKIPKEKVELFPYVSAMQIAFAKVKESWEDASLVSLHAKPLENLLRVLEMKEPDKIGIFTDDQNRPEVIAQSLIEKGLEGYCGYVCENLEGANEKISFGELKEIAEKTYASLNVMILIKKKKEQGVEPVLSLDGAKNWSIGIPDGEFYQRTPEKGLITKLEVRVLSLSKMNLHKNSIVWDIGAGSGSISIESALLAPEGKAYAIEKNSEDCALIQKNIQKFRTSNVEVLHGIAPDPLKQIQEDPDSVFIGGSSGNMFDILKISSDRLKAKGRIVVNVITIENLAEAWKSLKDLGLKSEVTHLQVSRTQPILNLTRFSALNPIWIITAWK